MSYSITYILTKCSEDEFDLDLEEIMVMEAIWQSIKVIIWPINFYLTSSVRKLLPLSHQEDYIGQSLLILLILDLLVK